METTILATVHTRSNFKQLNDKKVKVIQFLGTIVFCEYEYEGITYRGDFQISEIRSLTEIKD